MRTPHTTAPDWSFLRAGADRLAATFVTESAEGCSVALLGLPDENGVRLNNGRPGAAEGPRAFRRALAAYGTTYDALDKRRLSVRVFDAGDVRPSEAPGPDGLEETHARATEAARALLKQGVALVCVGGGHDLTLPTVRGLSMECGGAVGGINVDAHLDVRETVGSGMPFRRLIEGEFVEARRFVEYGVGRFVNERRHVEWLLSRGAEIAAIESVIAGEFTARDAMERALPEDGGAAFLSVDLDGIDGSQAPGVSSPNPMGLRVREVEAVVRAAGREPRVRMMDIMEFSPAHDVDGRTGRVAALLFLTFVAGVQERRR